MCSWENKIPATPPPNYIFNHHFCTCLFFCPLDQHFLSTPFDGPASNAYKVRSNFYYYAQYLNDADHSPKHFASIASVASGNWSDGTIWSGGVAPTAGDAVTISSGVTITVDVPNAVCQNITINNNGTLDFNAGTNLNVNGNWINNGNFNAGSGTVTFTGSASSYNSISGNSASAFNNIVVDKGTNPTFVLEATGTGAISNTGTLSITNGLFEMTTGTFQFGGIAGPNIPATGGIWVRGATLNGGNFTVTNDGWVRVSTGIANFGNSSGNSVHNQNKGYFDVSGGTVNISGRLENTASGAALTGIPSSGVSITGGTINLATVGNNASNTGSFDMSTSATLNMNNGTVVFQNASTAATPVDLNIISGGSKSITGGAFQFGTNPGNYKIDAGTSLYNLSLLSANISAQLVTINGNAYDLAIKNLLTLNGPFTLNDQNLIIGASAPAIAGTLGANNGMVITNGNGELRKNFTFSFAYFFPVASSVAGYAPVSLSFTAGSYAPGAYAGIKTVPVKHPSNPSTTGYLNRYWTINTSGINNPVYSVTATYLASDVVGSEAGMKMGKYSGALPWVKYDPANTVAHTLTATGYNEYRVKFIHRYYAGRSGL